MNEYFIGAEKLIKDVIKDLNRLIENDGEKIDCHNDIALDGSISRLIQAKICMNLGKYIDG